jgi:hypothetical protein
MAAFEAKLEAGRGGGAFAVIPADALAALGGGSRFRVRGSLNGVELATSTMSMGGGRVCVGVHKATRMAAGVAVGDQVRLELERDVRERVVDIPPELQAALADDEAARATYDGLSYTNRKEYAEWISSAKRPETRQRRLAKAVELLRAGVRHP